MHLASVDPTTSVRGGRGVKETTIDCHSVNLEIQRHLLSTGERRASFMRRQSGDHCRQVWFAFGVDHCRHVWFAFGVVQAGIIANTHHLRLAWLMPCTAVARAARSARRFHLTASTFKKITCRNPSSAADPYTTRVPMEIH